MSTEYRQAAAAMGRLLAEKGITLVFGGGRVGLMGEIAWATLRAGGEVIGVIPKALAEEEVAFTEMGNLRVVDSMHERKALMAELADAFIALPGGLGTLEELIEILTWRQLGFHQKPCGVLNTSAYFDPMIATLDHVVAEGFMAEADRRLLLVEDDPEVLLSELRSHDPPVHDKVAWALGKSQS